MLSRNMSATNQVQRASAPLPSRKYILLPTFHLMAASIRVRLSETAEKNLKLWLLLLLVQVMLLYSMPTGNIISACTNCVLT